MGHDVEKTNTEYLPDIEDRENSRDSSRDVVDLGFTPEEQKSIIRRVDRRLVTTVGFMYCVSLMDRTNLSAAAIAGYSNSASLISLYRC